MAGALRTTKAQLVLQDLISFMILAGVKCSKGNFTMDPFNELQSARAFICATMKDNSCLLLGSCFDSNAFRPRRRITSAEQMRQLKSRQPVSYTALPSLLWSFMLLPGQRFSPERFSRALVPTGTTCANSGQRATEVGGKAVSSFTKTTRFPDAAPDGGVAASASLQVWLHIKLSQDFGNGLFSLFFFQELRPTCSF